MKRKMFSALLCVCMLVSLLPAGAAAYADDGQTAAGEMLVEELPGEPQQEPAQEPEPEPAQQEPVQTPEPTQALEPTQAPEPTQTPEPAQEPEPSAQPDDKVTLADMSDADLEYYNSLLIELGLITAPYADKAALAQFFADMGITDFESANVWLNAELEKLSVRENAAACIGDEYFATVDEAIASVSNSAVTTITLLRDAEEESVFVPMGRNIILDLNGFALYITGATETAPLCFTVEGADVLVEGTTDQYVYEYAEVYVKNGSIFAYGGDANGVAILNNGSLRLEDVAVTGGIVHDVHDASCALSIDGGSVDGLITTVEGGTVSVTGGLFRQDVTAYIDAAVYRCELSGDGWYSVAPLVDDAAVAAVDRVAYDINGVRLNVAVTERRAGTVSGADGLIPGSAVALSGLEKALRGDAVSALLEQYLAQTPAVLSLDAEEEAAAKPAAEDADVSLFVRAELRELGEGRISYEVKPYASVTVGEDTAEFDISNDKLKGTPMTLSIYTGFEPTEMHHIHEDAAVDTYVPEGQATAETPNTFTYDPATGMATLSISSFSVIDGEGNVAKVGDMRYQKLQDAVNAAIVSGEEVVLIAAVAEVKNVEIPAGASVVINTKNILTHSMTGTGTDPMFKIGGALRILGDGTVDALTGSIAEFTSASGSLTLGDESSTGIIKPTYKAASLVSGTTAGTVTIYEANTSFDPASPVNYVAEGYKAEYKNLTGLWEIRVKYVARVVATEYRTFAEAYAAASTGSTVAGQTIILLDDIDEGDITIADDVYIDGQLAHKYGIKGNVTITPEAQNVFIWNTKIDGTLTHSGTGANLTSVEVINTEVTGAVDLGDGLNLVVIDSVTAPSVAVGSDAKSVTVRSDVKDSDIGTLTIGAGSKADIHAGLLTNVTNIGTLVAQTGANVTLGGSISTALTDKKLVVNTIESTGNVEVYSGTYENLNGEVGSIMLYGGNYPVDYSEYGGCKATIDKVHYSHYICEYVKSEARYRVSVLKPIIVSPASGRADYSGNNLSFVTDAPYTHVHTGAEPEVLSVTVGRNELRAGTDYSVSPCTLPDGTVGTMVTIYSSYINTLSAGTYNVQIDTEVGTAQRYADYTPAGFRVRTSTITNRNTLGRSGIIRTGDDANLALLAGVMLCTGLAAAGGVYLLRRKKEK